MNLYKIILIVFFSYFFSINLFAQEKKNIIIKGNEFIDDEVIYSIVGENFDQKSDDYINNNIKSLNDTGNFKKIEVEENNNELIIKVLENAKVKKVNFEGNKRFNKDVIFDLFNKNEYFQYINEIKINEFIDELKKIYLSYGYNQINIEYKITKDPLDNNFAVLDFFISEGKISKINKIYFVGNIFFNKRELLSEIKSKEQNLLVLFGDKNFKKYQVNNDLISLESFYRNNGFRDISIDYKTEYLISKNKFNIYFYINEGKKYQFGQIDIDTKSINISDLQNEELASIFKKYYSKKIKKNNNYNRSYMDDMKNILSDFLFNNGIMFFEIIILDKIEDSIVDVVFLIEPAKPKYVNQINVYGNKRTLDKVIRREVTFAEGDAINSELIRNTKRNIDGLRIFSNVQIDEVYVNNDQIDVDIKVEEKSTGEFQVGLSVGTLEGATFVTGLKEKNISGLGREIDLEINTSEKNTIFPDSPVPCFNSSILPIKSDILPITA